MSFVKIEKHKGVCVCHRFVKIEKHIGVCVCHRSYLLWPSIIIKCWSLFAGHGLTKSILAMDQYVNNNNNGSSSST